MNCNVEKQSDIQLLISIKTLLQSFYLSVFNNGRWIYARSITIYPGTTVLNPGENFYLGFVVLWSPQAFVKMTGEIYEITA